MQLSDLHEQDYATQLILRACATGPKTAVELLVELGNHNVPLTDAMLYDQVLRCHLIFDVREDSRLVYRITPHGRLSITMVDQILSSATDTLYARRVPQQGGLFEQVQ